MKKNDKFNSLLLTIYNHKSQQIKVNSTIFKRFQKLYGPIVYFNLLKYKHIITKIKTNISADIDYSDIYGELLIKLCNKIKTLKNLNHYAFCTYIKKTVYNQLIDEYRKTSRKTKKINKQKALQNISDLNTSEINTQKEKMIYQIHQIVEKLTKKQKEIVLLKYYKNMAVEDIAQELNITSRAVYKRLKLIKNKIRNELQDNPDFRWITSD